MEIVKAMYILDVVQNAKGLFTVVLVVGMIAAAVLVACWLGAKSDGDDDFCLLIRPYLKGPVIAVVIAAIPFLFSPSKATLYTYAGLKTAEAIMESSAGKALTQEAKEVLMDVKNIVHEYSANLGKGK